MSRGYSLVNPKEIPSTGVTIFDGCGWLWVFTSTHIYKIFLKDIDSRTQKQIDTDFSSLKVTVKAGYNQTYGSAVLVDDYIYISIGNLFTQIMKIHVQTHESEIITVPAQMNSNLHYESSKLWMVTNDSSLQVSDKHKMYVFDLDTNKWSNSDITTKKQQDPFRIWSNGDGYVYTSNWTNFNCSRFDSITGTYIDSFNVNGYPGPTANADVGSTYIASFGGMISHLAGTTVTHSHNSIEQCNGFGGHLAYTSGYIWFQSDEVFGRIKVSDKTVIDSKATDDTNILSAVGFDTIDSNYAIQPIYTINNTSFKDLYLIPRYTITDEAGAQQVIKEKLVLVGSVITIFDPDLVKFVFDKPEEILSGVGSTGKGMITTGETGYIGEYA